MGPSPGFLQRPYYLPTHPWNESHLRGECQRYGTIHCSFGIEEYFSSDNIYRHDIGQILLAFSHLVNNVRKPAILLPSSIASAMDSAKEVQAEIIDVEQFMTDKWSSRSIPTEFEHLEDLISMQRSYLVYNTGLASKAVFERMYGQEAILEWESFQNFEHDYPDMEFLGYGKRPRYRHLSCEDWYCGCQASFVEVAMPPADLDHEGKEQWYEEERMECEDWCPSIWVRGYPFG